MAKAKVSGKSKTKSAAKSSSNSKKAKTLNARPVSIQTSAQQSLKQAREYVSERTTLPNAGLALAGAGLLALVSTQKGRNLVRAAAETVISLVNLPAIQDQVTETLKPFRSTSKSNSKNQSKAQL